MIRPDTQNRSPLFNGLGLTLRRFPALLWAFAFNFIYSAVTTARVAGTIGVVTNSSLASRSLHHGFDLGTVAGLGLKLSEGTGLSPSFSTSVLLYLATYFLLVPGTLLCYQTGAPARLSTLLSAGLLHFWRFVRILILSLLVFALILGPLVAIWSKITDKIDASIVGRPSFLLDISGFLLIALIAAILRLYFDLVEVYTVQLGLNLRPNGKPDRRVRKTLGPAFRALRYNFGQAYLPFLLLALLGFVAVALTARISMHSLAQPRVWPMFLLAQTGLFLLLFTRFWQRGAETTLAINRPILEKPIVRTTFVPRDPIPPPTHFESTYPVLVDPIPAPEPATPSLLQPDPGIYHHDVPTPPHRTIDDPNTGV